MTKEQARDFRDHDVALRLASAISSHARCLVSPVVSTMDDDQSGFSDLVVELRRLIAELRGAPDPVPDVPSSHLSDMKKSLSDAVREAGKQGVPPADVVKAVKAFADELDREAENVALTNYIGRISL